jgi:two-component system sensor histidine kinase AtoS
MSNSITKIANITSTLRTKAPGVVEFKALLNLFEEPALIIDATRFQVVLANSQFFQLTSYSQNEITDTALDFLIPDLDMIQLLSSGPHEVSLVRRNRSTMQVIVRLLPLENSVQWALLSVTPSQKSIRSDAVSHRQKVLLKSFHTLSQLTDQPDISSALFVAIDIGLSILCTDTLCIYYADSQTPKLDKVKTSVDKTNDGLPDNIPSTDLIKLTSPTLWLPGKRVSTELHRVARIKNLSCIATAPLGQQGAWLGLLVAANNQTPPDDDLVELLNVIAGHITSTLQHFIMIANTSATIKRINEVLPVQKCIIENTQEGIIILLKDLTILEMNPAAELMLGYTSSEVTGQSIENILIGTESLQSALISARNGIPAHNLGSLYLHRRNGQSFPAEIQTIPVSVDSKVTNVVILLSDVSEVEQVRVKTHQLEQRALLGEVMAIFAHEVRNPINNISTGLQYISTDLQEGSPIQDLTNRLQGDCTRLTVLMDSVLTFSKGTEYRMEDTDIKALVQRLLERWRPRFTNANVQFYLQSSLKTPKVIGDNRALDQVFTNLISNAVNAMREKGGLLAIKIELQTVIEDPPQMLITVTDNGAGIPDDIRERIFEPFVTSNAYQGTGLGLAITKRILVAHHGSIHVDSFPGGTIFTIKLPAVKGES